MVPLAPRKPKKIPNALTIVIGFFFALSAFQVFLLLRQCITAPELRREFLMDILLRGLLSLLAFLTSVQLILRLPLARASAVLILAGFPGITALQYVLYPLTWQIEGRIGRIQDFVSAGIFLALAGILMTGGVSTYLAPDPRERAAPAAPPAAPSVADSALPPEATPPSPPK